ncbi:MAG TPA: OPT/YSL family transporter, partial [Methanocellaceae archaeon]
MKKATILIVLVGVIFSMANAFVSMYMGMKIGFADGIAVLLLFAAFIIFTAVGMKSRLKSLVCVSAIVMGSTGVAISYTDGLGAILLSGTPFNVPDYAMTGILLLSGITGILISSYFADYFLKSPFPWPGSRMTASLISMLAAEKSKASQKVSMIRMGVAAFASGGIALLRSFSILPDFLGSVNIGLSMSPMMAGIGMLIGWRSCLQMAGGALVSLLVFVLLESPGTDYTTHMKSPWVFSTAVAMMVTTAVITMYFVLKPAFRSFMDRQRGEHILAADGGTRKYVFAPTSLRHYLLIAAIAGVALLLAVYPGVPAWIFLIAILIAVLFMIV